MHTPDWLKLKNLGEKLSKLELLSSKRLPDNNLSAVSLMRVTEGAKLHIISQLPLRKLVVTADSLAAKSTADKLRRYIGQGVYYLPHRDDVLLPRKSFSAAGVRGRSIALSAIVCGAADTIVVSADSLLQSFPSKNLVRRYTVVVKTGDIISPQLLCEKLAAAGYIRQQMPSAPGEFALRGDILDIFGIDNVAYRVSFFDELIEDIKTYDSETMLSLNTVEGIIIPPASDILTDETSCETACSVLKKYSENKYAGEALSMLRVGACSPNAVWALPFMPSATVSLLEFLDDGVPTEIILDEPKVVYDKLLILQKEFEGRLDTLLRGGEILNEHKNALIPLNEVKRLLLTARKLSFSSLNLSNPIFEPKLIIEPKTRAVTKYYLDPPSIYVDLKNFILNKFKVLIACGNVERAHGVLESLRAEDVFAGYSEDGNGFESIQVTPLSIETGFIYPDMKVCVIGVSECVGRHKGEDVNLPKTQFIAPKEGDYVVHRVHGVGLCEGTSILKSGEFEKEYIVLKYRDGDTLYVATDQMDNLQKFVGEEHPQLNKIGGREFEREKEKVRKSVRKLAFNLLELYAKREKQRGFKYSEDTVWQQEFEDSFEYEETADQLKAIAEIKKDMEDGRIMDRLLVGDVGFGKTEIAFRAMFKTVLDSKQAVLLAPTTILARQHYENLIKRLEPFGISCALLTRLQSPAENKRVVAQLKEGNLHIVIATHKVLSKEVDFQDLGLLVLDEEQRFGVEHKEKLKEKFPLVNVLTLSATPIPRTLNMALSGVRDISLLETAPRGRLPVQTYVVEYSETMIIDAVERESARGGQTLILLNDIAALDGFASRLRGGLKGEIRVVTAHGQMAGGELEKRISAFYERRYDVLIATTIIENGIDLPDANTLIVVNSGNFGLSQLYQLRGRVGRRGVLAHAYFTVPSNGIMSSSAEKRLKALLDNTEIGSGFKVALSDLSIRGAGTLLGAEQSGHIERVGYEMYLELLDEAVEELKTGCVHKEARDVEMKIDASAYIRDGYVSGRDKLKVYKRISSVSGIQSMQKLIAELNEIYGPVEQPLLTLINISMLKNLAKSFDVSRVIINRKGVAVNFYDAEIFKNESLMKAVAAHAEDAVLTNNIPPSLIFNADKLTAEQKIDKLINFFANI